jgi:hypothetical protein
MSRQANKMVSQLEEAPDVLKSKVAKAEDDLRSGVDNSVKKGKKAVKEHPVAALGVALGATLVAGAVAGAQLERNMKHKAKGAARRK